MCVGRVNSGERKQEEDRDSEWKGGEKRKRARRLRG